MVERGRPQMTIWRMLIACWIPKATNTHSGCVTPISFPPQQWLHGSVSLLRYTNNACVVNKTVGVKVQGSVHNELLAQQIEGRDLI